MQLSRALRLSQDSCIAFTGAGGKTTALFQAAHELSQNSKSPTQNVIVTTTTHLGTWQIPLADKHLAAQKTQELAGIEFRGVTLVTGPLQDDQRTEGVSEDILSWLREKYKLNHIPLLVEADGSRQKPLKAPGGREPVIPDSAEEVVVVAGLSGLGKPLTDEFVHRPERFAELSGMQIGEPVTPEALVQVLLHTEGGLKNIPANARKVAFLNQADTLELQAIGGKIARSLLEGYDSVVVGSVQLSKFQTIEPAAGILLAAGGSKRFGHSKQLLDWRGQPFVRVVARTALAANLSPVVIVTGANAQEVETAVNDLRVRIVRNEAWQEGQASSIRAGVNALPPQTGAAIFLLADQPQVTASILQALVEEHTRELPAILAPLVMDQRANPVLFDRVTFLDLLKLQGDVGGRGIFDKHPLSYLPWNDDRLLLDVDTPEHYQRLVEDETL